VIAFTVPVDEAAAEAISSLFVECIVAPAFAEEAVEILGRKKNLRVLEGKAPWPANGMDYKRVRGGVLVQDRARGATARQQWKVVTSRSPPPRNSAICSLRGRAVASVKSNAIVLAQRRHDRHWRRSDEPRGRELRGGAQGQDLPATTPRAPRSAPMRSSPSVTASIRPRPRA
jgi:hypothetical protein